MIPNGWTWVCWVYGWYVWTRTMRAMLAGSGGGRKGFRARKSMTQERPSWCKRACWKGDRATRARLQRQRTRIAGRGRFDANRRLGRNHSWPRSSRKSARRCAASAFFRLQESIDEQSAGNTSEFQTESGGVELGIAIHAGRHGSALALRCSRSSGALLGRAARVSAPHERDLFQRSRTLPGPDRTWLLIRSR